MSSSLDTARRPTPRVPTPAPLDLLGRSRSAASVPAVTVVVPTRNEQDNVARLTAELTAAFADTAWELLFVDDSTDDTCHIIGEIAASQPRVRLHHRPVDQRASGLGGAVATGFALAEGEVVVVMDGDLQHPPQVAPQLAAVVASGAADVAVASRYSPGGGGANGLAGRRRAAVSHVSRFTARLLLRPARGVRDPLGGFFAVRRAVVPQDRLQPRGYKILLELLVRTPGVKVVEVPYTFRAREAGVSKAGLREGARFARHLASLLRADRER